MINIHARVKHLIQKTDTNNPYLIANYLHIKIYYANLDYETKGFYIKLLGNKFIVINSKLDERLKCIVLAHEIGHAVLHSNNSACFIREYTLFPRGIYENEANKFAAELLIEDKDIDKSCLKDLSISQLSSYFKVPESLIEYKFKNKKGK